MACVMLIACGRVGFEPADRVRPDAAAGCLCGDVDGDGAVGVRDIEALGDILSRPRTLDACEAFASDVNGDGFVDGDDIAALADGSLSCRP